MNGYSYFARLHLRAGHVSGLLLLWLLAAPPAAQAQSARPLVLTSYYDSARTQRRVVYRARRVGADTVAHGTFRRYWPGGSLQELGHFTEGQADSIWTRYYPAKAGQQSALARRLPMRGGKPEGVFTVWHPDGRVGQRGTFRNGQLVDSLVTLKPDGQRRLTAQFTENAAGRLQGSFWQRGGRYTALPLTQDLLLLDPYAYSTLYLAYDPRRYWTGQLVAGRVAGTLTEHDADGQPTVRLAYTAHGRLRLVTRYYPGAWRRYALQNFDVTVRQDSLVPATLFWQWEPVGQRGESVLRWWRLENETPTVQLLQLVPAAQHSETSHGDVTGAQDQAARLASAPPDLSARLTRFTAPALPGTCPAARQAYQAQLRPHLVLVKRPPGRWLLGEADTTGATHQPLQRADFTLADGRRQVETARRSRTYYASGTLQSVEYRRRLGRELSRDYYPSGRRQGVDRRGLLASYDRSWDEEGHADTELERLLGVRMVRKRVARTRKGQRVYVTKTRPRFWESKKSRRRYRPH